MSDEKELYTNMNGKFVNMVAVFYVKENGTVLH